MTSEYVSTAQGQNKLAESLGLAHEVLMGMCGHYRACIAAQDSALTFAKALLTAQGVVPQPPTTTTAPHKSLLNPKP